MVGLPRQAAGVQPSHGGPGSVTSAGPNGAVPGGYLPNPQQQQQAAMMKQMIAMEQEKRVQRHLMEQQKAQLLREQRQQQQQHMLAEQVSATDSAQLLFKILIWNSHTCQCASSCLTLRSFGVQISVIIDKEFWYSCILSALLHFFYPVTTAAASPQTDESGTEESIPAPAVSRQDTHKYTEKISMPKHETLCHFDHINLWPNGLRF